MAVEAKHSGFRVARLGMRCHTTDLNKTQAKSSPSLHCFSALVHASSKAKPVFEMKPPKLNRIGNARGKSATKKGAAQ